MRHIALSDDSKIPRNDEFNFKSRAQALVEKWQKIAKDHEDAQANGIQTNGNTGEKNNQLLATDVTMDSIEPNGIADISQDGTSEIPNGKHTDIEVKVNDA
jgi:hypothetical protein